MSASAMSLSEKLLGDAASTACCSSSAWPALTEVAPARPASGDRPEASPVYKARYAQEGPRNLGVGTLLEMFEQSVQLHGHRPCLGHRPLDSNGVALPFEFKTYSETAELVAHVGSAYASLGLQPKDRVGVIGANAPEWMMAMQGLNRMNMVCVPLYDTLGEAAVQYIIRHAETRLVVSAGSKLAAVARALAKTKEVVTCGVVYWGAAPSEAVQGLRDQGFQVLSWHELVERGARNQVEPCSRPVPGDLCTIMYTSGTTGDPKGVMISHRAVLSTISGVMHYLDHLNESLSHADSYLSFLPLAHIMDRVLEELMLSVGASVGYYQGDVKKVIDDVGALRPTLFVGVPRVFERVYNGVVEQVKRGGWLRSLVFHWAFKRKLYFMRKGWRYDQASVVSDLLVFNKIKQRLGGRVRVIVSGGAPLSPTIEQFLKVCMCTPVVQGYGLTETCAASFIAHPYRMDHLGSVGAPMPQTELRFEAVPEMGYSPSHTPPSGEILIRGPAVFTSYYKDEAMSRECIDADGFFHTGDIGVLVADGSLKIVDRKKNIFKLSHGEYIAVERLENVYKQCPLVEQIWVYGSSMESMLVAVVVPAEAAAKVWARANGAEEELKALCQRSDFKAHVMAQLTATGKGEKLKGFEEVKAVHLEPEQFSVDNGLMTPKFSLKRNVLLQRYQALVDGMYRDLQSGGSNGTGAAQGGSRVGAWTSNPTTSKKTE